MQIKSYNANPSFCAGKVHVYSDFDGTYCPERHSSMHNPERKQSMVDYCNKMRDFFISTKDDLNFHITTGRTFGEYEAVSWLLKFRDYRLPFPKSVITKNGSDEFTKIGSDDDFYNNNKFPFNYNITSQQKEGRIKELTNWNGKEIKKHIRNAAKNLHLNFIEADSENSERDYGQKSLFSNGKLNKREWTKLPNDDGDFIVHENPIVDFNIGSRNDGNLKLHLIFPPDYGYCPFRNYIYDSYMSNIKNYLAENNVNYFQSWDEANKNNYYRISTTITPKINEEELTKLFDTKEAVKNAKKNNDLVIAAGDSSNDFKMLNPLEYIPQKDWEMYAKNSDNKEFYLSDMKKKLRDLKHIYRGNDSEYINDLRKELTENGFLQRLDELPFIGIVINKEKSPLKKLVDTFSHSGKIICVENGMLDEGIKQAIKIYQQKNQNFENKMSDKFKYFVNK